MDFLSQFPNKFRAAIAVAALACFLVGAPAVAQDPVPVGDNRPATIGDLKNFREENRKEFHAIRAEMRENNSQIRAEMRENNSQIRDEIREGNNQIRAEIRESINTLWSALVLGLVAIVAALIGFAAVLFQLARQAPAQNSPPRPAGKLQVAVAAILIIAVITAAVPVVKNIADGRQTFVVAAENSG